MSDNSCSQSGLIQEFLDAQTDKMLKSRLDAHLKECPTCRKEFAEFESLFQSLGKSLKIPETCPDSALMAKMRKEVAAKRPDSKDSPLAWFERLFAVFFRPALVLAVVLLIFSFVIIRSRSTLKPDMTTPVLSHSSLNLEKNEVDVVFSLDSDSVKVGNKLIKVAELKSFEAGPAYALPESSVVVLRSDASKIKLTKAARFRLARNSFELLNGHADFSLKGDHKDFELKTDFATVSVIGTEFEAQVANNQLSVKLSGGKIVVKTTNGSVMQLDKPMQSVVVDRQGSFVEISETNKNGALPAVSGQPDRGPADSDSGGNLENTF